MITWIVSWSIHVITDDQSQQHAQLALWQGHISPFTPLPFEHTCCIGNFPGLTAATRPYVQGIGQSQRQELTDKQITPFHSKKTL